MRFHLLRTRSVQPTECSTDVRAFETDDETTVYGASLYEQISGIFRVKMKLMAIYNKHSIFLRTSDLIRDCFLEGDTVFVCVIPEYVKIWHDVENCHFKDKTLPDKQVYELVVRQCLATSIGQNLHQLDHLDVFGLIDVDWTVPYDPKKAGAVPYLPSDSLQHELMLAGVRFLHVPHVPDAVDNAVKKLIYQELSAVEAVPERDPRNDLYVLLSGDKDFCGGIRRCLRSGVTTLVVVPGKQGSRSSMTALALSQHHVKYVPIWGEMMGMPGGQAAVPALPKRVKSSDPGPPVVSSTIKVKAAVAFAMDRFFGNELRTNWADAGLNDAILTAQATRKPYQLVIEAQSQDTLTSAIRIAKAYVDELSVTVFKVHKPFGEVRKNGSVTTQAMKDSAYAHIIKGPAIDKCILSIVYKTKNRRATASVAHGGEMHTLISSLYNTYE